MESLAIDLISSIQPKVAQIRVRNNLPTRHWIKS